MPALNEHPTYYDVLELKPDASPQEIREAYLRTKGAYNKDSVALYTLISTEEREEMLSYIEEAYEVLSHPEKRREYDRHHGLISMEQELLTHKHPSSHKKIISIDRVPPMESAGESDAESLLVAPSTDFTSGSDKSTELFGATESPIASSQQQHQAQQTQPAPTPAPAAAEVIASHAPAASVPAPAPSPMPVPPSAASAQAPKVERRKGPTAEPLLAQEITQEIEWKGLFLRKVREARRISVEELSGVTKISKTYILAIEDENFPKLPAAVYLRGFVIQMAKVLKLPHEQVAGAYMARYYQARPDQKPK